MEWGQMDRGHRLLDVPADEDGDRPSPLPSRHHSVCLGDSRSDSSVGVGVGGLAALLEAHTAVARTRTYQHVSVSGARSGSCVNPQQQTQQQQQQRHPRFHRRSASMSLHQLQQAHSRSRSMLRKKRKSSTPFALALAPASASVSKRLIRRRVSTNDLASVSIRGEASASVKYDASASASMAHNDGGSPMTTSSAAPVASASVASASASALLPRPRMSHRRRRSAVASASSPYVGRSVRRRLSLDAKLKLLEDRRDLPSSYVLQHTCTSTGAVMEAAAAPSTGDDAAADTAAVEHSAIPLLRDVRMCEDFVPRGSLPPPTSSIAAAGSGGLGVGGCLSPPLSPMPVLGSSGRQVTISPMHSRQSSCGDEVSHSQAQSQSLHHNHKRAPSRTRRSMIFSKRDSTSAVCSAPRFPDGCGSVADELMPQAPRLSSPPSCPSPSRPGLQNEQNPIVVESDATMNIGSAIRSDPVLSSNEKTKQIEMENIPQKAPAAPIDGSSPAAVSACRRRSRPTPLSILRPPISTSPSAPAASCGDDDTPAAVEDDACVPAPIIVPDGPKINMDIVNDSDDAADTAAAATADDDAAAGHRRSTRGRRQQQHRRVHSLSSNVKRFLGRRESVILLEQIDSYIDDAVNEASVEAAESRRQRRRTLADTNVSVPNCGDDDDAAACGGVGGAAAARAAAAGGRGDADTSAKSSDEAMSDDEDSKSGDEHPPPSPPKERRHRVAPMQLESPAAAAAAMAPTSSSVRARMRRVFGLRPKALSIDETYESDFESKSPSSTSASSPSSSRGSNAPLLAHALTSASLRFPLALRRSLSSRNRSSTLPLRRGSPRTLPRLSSLSQSTSESHMSSSGDGETPTRAATPRTSLRQRLALRLPRRSTSTSEHAAATTATPTTTPTSSSSSGGGAPMRSPSMRTSRSSLSSRSFLPAALSPRTRTRSLRSRSFIKRPKSLRRRNTPRSRSPPQKSRRFSNKTMPALTAPQRAMIRPSNYFSETSTPRERAQSRKLQRHLELTSDEFMAWSAYVRLTNKLIRVIGEIPPQFELESLATASQNLTNENRSVRAQRQLRANARAHGAPRAHVGLAPAAPIVAMPLANSSNAGTSRHAAAAAERSRSPRCARARARTPHAESTATKIERLLGLPVTEIQYYENHRKVSKVLGEYPTLDERARLATMASQRLGPDYDPLRMSRRRAEAERAAGGVRRACPPIVEPPRLFGNTSPRSDYVAHLRHVPAIRRPFVMRNEDAVSSPVSATPTPVTTPHTVTVRNTSCTASTATAVLSTASSLAASKREPRLILQQQQAPAPPAVVALPLPPIDLPRYLPLASDTDADTADTPLPDEGERKEAAAAATAAVGVDTVKALPTWGVPPPPLRLFGAPPLRGRLNTEGDTLSVCSASVSVTHNGANRKFSTSYAQSLSSLVE